MKSDVITRHVDEIGRVIIPIEFRRELEIPANKDSKVYISEPNKNDVFTVIFNAPHPNAIITAVFGFLILPKNYHLHDCTLDLWLEDGKLYMKKTIPQCILSGDTENLLRYQNTDKYISERVIKSMYESMI